MPAKHQERCDESTTDDGTTVDHEDGKSDDGSQRQSREEECCEYRRRRREGVWFRRSELIVSRRPQCAVVGIFLLSHFFGWGFFEVFDFEFQDRSLETGLG